MIPLGTALAFFGVSILLALTPGPDNIFVLVQAASRGRQAGMLVVLGLCTGLVVHTAAVALGLAAVFAASATAFTILKFAGAAYLAFLAWQAFRAPAGELAASGLAAGQPWRMYARGIIMNLTNPKIVFFFLAFLPQFVRPESGPVGLQVMSLGLLFILATLLVFGAIACFAGAIGQRLGQSAYARQALNRLAGTVFLGLAIRLALTES